MKKMIFDLILVALILMCFVGCKKKDTTVDLTEESAAVSMTATGEPGPVTFEVACDVKNDFTWVPHDYDETIIAITGVDYELGDPGKATLTLTPVAPGTTRAYFVYCTHGIVEGNIKGYAEYNITVDENMVVSYEQVKVHFESQYNPGKVAEAGAPVADENAVMGAVYEDVGEEDVEAEYEQIN